MASDAKRKALEALRGLADQAMGARLRGLKQPPPAPVEATEPAPEECAEAGLEDEDARRLIELYEAKQAEV